MFAALRTAFPDFHIEVEHLVGTDDEVAFAYRIAGTQEGLLMGSPASGKRPARPR